MAANPVTEFTTEKRERFLRELASTGNVSGASKRARTSRMTVYRLRDEDADFRALWDEAIEIAVDALELEARRRAHKGTLDPVYQGGQLVGKVRKFSDTLLIFLLKAHRPDKFRDRASVELSGPGGKPIETRTETRPDLSDYTTEELLQLRNIERTRQERQDAQCESTP